LIVELSFVPQIGDSPSQTEGHRASLIADDQYQTSSRYSADSTLPEHLPSYFSEVEVQNLTTDIDIMVDKVDRSKQFVSSHTSNRISRQGNP